LILGGEFQIRLLDLGQKSNRNDRLSHTHRS